MMSATVIGPDASNPPSSQRLRYYCLAFPMGWVALAPQAFILASILKVTGIPATEAQALRSKGDAYRAYQQRVSAFIPIPPRRS